MVDNRKVVILENLEMYGVCDSRTRNLLNGFDSLSEAIDWCELMGFEIMSSPDGDYNEYDYDE